MRALNVFLAVLISLALALLVFEGGLRLFPAYRPQETLNRFDETLVYATLTSRDLGAIFDKFLEEITTRAMQQAGMPLLIKVTDTAKAAIIEHGTDPLLGARPLRRAMEHDVVDPLSRLLVSGQVVAGDVVEVDLQPDGDLAFYRYSRDSQRVVA